MLDARRVLELKRRSYEAVVHAVEDPRYGSDESVMPLLVVGIGRKNIGNADCNCNAYDRHRPHRGQGAFARVVLMREVPGVFASIPWLDGYLVAARKARYDKGRAGWRSLI